jgi:PAT family acetyl-CoA transporter-like MFS transporter 1
MLVVRSFPVEGVTTSYFFIVMSSTVMSSFMSTVQFVSLGSFFSKISDPRIGGTYMTLVFTCKFLMNKLNTISNLGGTWPKWFVLEAVDYFTTSQCHSNVLSDDGSSSILDLPSGFNCNKEAVCFQSLTFKGKEACKNMQGVCMVVSDGYYSVGSASFIAGCFVLVFVVLPGVKYLESLPDSVWRLQEREETKKK